MICSQNYVGLRCYIVYSRIECLEIIWQKRQGANFDEFNANFIAVFEPILEVLQVLTTIRMSHWRPRTTEDAEFWITCKQLGFLISFSSLQVIQNKHPWCSAVQILMSSMPIVANFIAIFESI